MQSRLLNQKGDKRALFCASSAVRASAMELYKTSVSVGGADAPGWTAIWGLRCAQPECRANSVLRAVSRRKNGIRLSGDWYCSPECFELAIRDRLPRLFSSGRAPVDSRRSRMPLGLLLLSRGEISSEQLRTALANQRTSGERIGEVIQRLGFAREQQITSAVAAQWGYPVFSLRNRALQVPIHIPAPILEFYQVLPVHYAGIGRKLLIGFVNAVEHRLLYTIEHMTGCTAVPCFITATEHRTHLHSFTIRRSDHEVVFERGGSIQEMARIARSYAVQIGAEEARLASCGDYVWARVTGQRQEMDLLFRSHTR